MTGDEHSPTNRIPARALILGLALLGIAGFVDAAGFLALGLFPSFRSGDTTQLGIALAQGRQASALLLGGMVAIFVAGAFLGRLLSLHGSRRSTTLGLEALLLATAAGGAHWGWAAAALSISHNVRRWPRAPATGIATSPAPPSANATAPAFDAPVVTIHTSAALWMAGSVSDTRVGGGLGHPCTATTERSVSYTAGECGNTEAV